MHAYMKRRHVHLVRRCSEQRGAVGVANAEHVRCVSMRHL